MNSVMTLDDELHILRNIPLFGGIEPEKLKLLAFVSERIFFKRRQKLFSEGDQANAGYVILSGDVDVFTVTENGETSRTCDVEQYTIIGFHALFNDEPRTTTAVAIDDVKALRISRDSFQQFINTCPETMSIVMASMSEQISQAN